MKKTLAEALEARGYTTLTAVQEAVTAPELQGKDLLVSAQTGSGKTLGFGLAIAPTLLGDDDHFAQAGAPLALVIAPTRELALQVKRELAWLFEKAGAVLASTVGGMDMRDERRALARGAHIVVSTPGRLRDHIMRGSIDLTALRAVVLDEADEMLDLGFREDLEFILDTAPSERQTLLFSATVPAAIAKLAQSYQQDAQRIETTSTASQHADIDYRAYQVSARDGENAIINVLRYYEAPNAIVFCNTRAMVNRLTTRLSNRGFSVVALSGELSQSERTHALQAMRDGRARVCVATDVAARGIDLPNLDLVIHAELPSNQDTLLHRSGRTGRAGRKGVSAMIVPPASRKKAQRLLGWAKLRAEWADAPSAEAVLAQDEARILASPDLLEPAEESDQGTVEKLIASFAPEQIAAAYLRLYRERHSAPEELADVSEPAKPREAFGPSVWFSVQGGRDVGAEPRRLLPMLCKMGNLSKDDIGAIRIQPDASLFEIREPAVDGFLKAVGAAMVLEDGAALTRLDAAPRFDKSPRRPDAPRTSAPKYAAPRKDVPAAARKDAPSAPRKDAPRKDAPAAARSETPGTTKPVDWNDAPVPRVKKPKRDAKAGAKPPHKASGKPAGKPAGKAPRKAVGEFPAKTFADPSKKLRLSKGRPTEDSGKGPRPPVGKPSSKKNRARIQAAGKPGGAAVPMRKPTKPGRDKPRGKS